MIPKIKKMRMCPLFNWESPWKRPSIVFQNAPVPAGGEAPQLPEMRVVRVESGTPLPTPEATRAEDERIKASKEKVKDDGKEQRVAVAEGIHDPNKLPDISGDASEYKENFFKKPQYDLVLEVLQAGQAAGNQNDLFKPERWVGMVPPGANAEIFKLAFMPQTKGLGDFVAGLELAATNPSDPHFIKCQQILFEISKQVADDLQEMSNRQEDFKHHEKTPLLGHTVSELSDTVMKNYKNAPGKEKLLMVAAAAGLAWWAWGQKDKKVPGFDSLTRGELATYAAVAFTLNWGVSKFDPKGRTALQMLDVGPSVEDLQIKKNKNLAVGLKMGENPRRLETFEKVMFTDVKKLYKLYHEVKTNNSVPESEKVIPPEKLDMRTGEFDGRSLYEMMDELVIQTAANVSGKKADEVRADSVVSNRLTLFERKYINDNAPLAKAKPTLFRAVFYEYGNEEFIKENEKYDAGKLGNRVAEGIKGTAGDVKDFTVEKWGKVTDWTAEKWDAFMKHVGTPLGSWAKGRYKEYSPYVGNAFDSAVAYYQESYVNDVIPPEFDMKVTAPGMAIICGVPNVLFSRETAKEGDKKDNEVVTVNGLEFLASAKLPDDNKDESEELLEKLSDEVKEVIKTKTPNTPLARKDPEWDPTTKSWLLKDVEVAGNPLLSPVAGKENVTVTLNKIKEPTFSINGHVIENLQDIKQSFDNSLVEKAIAGNPDYKALVGLPVLLDQSSIIANATYGSTFSGTLGGLKFEGVPKNRRDLSAGIEFTDSGVAGGLEKLHINGNGGAEFLNRLAAKELSNPDFLAPFYKLDAQMDNAGESFWERLAASYKTRDFWVLPGNPASGINGKILQTQWKYMLDFKKMETLDQFQYALQNQTADKIPAMYTKYVKTTLDALSGISTSITSEGSDEVRADQFDRHYKELETINYHNPDYETLFVEYRDMLKEHNLEGSETLSDTALAGNSHEIYQILLSVWEANTYAYGMQPGPISPADQHQLRQGVKDRIDGVLTNLEQGDNVVKLDELPAHGTADEMRRWVDPAVAASLSIHPSPWAIH